MLRAYFLLTFAFSWGLWKAFDRLYLGGQLLALPFIMLGMFGPGLMGLLLSARLNPGPAQGSRQAGALAFVAAWMPATVLISLDQVLNEGRTAAPDTVAVCAVTALIPAFVVSCVFSTHPGVRQHLSTLIRPKGRSLYYAIALGLFAALWLLGVAVSRALGLPVPEREYPVAAARIGIVAAIALDFLYNVMPNALSEEVGWRGFALPRLQARHSPLVASVVLAAFWAVWHAPAYFGGFAAQSVEDTIVEWLFLLPVSIVFTWLYNRAQGSLLVTALLHPAMNTATHFLPVTLGGVLLLAIFVAFIIVRDRMWRRLPAPGPA